MEETFEALLRGLEGTTVLAEPRVSRNTIISTLREHTNLIHDIRADMNNVNKTMSIVSAEASENRLFITQLKEDSAKNQKGIDTLLKITDEFRRQFTTLSDQIDDLPIIKQQYKEQKLFVEDLAMKFHVHVAELTEFVGKTNKSIGSVEQRCTDTYTHLKEIEDYVNHFEETLILPSSQIRVETSAGFSDHPLSLLEVLSQCNSSFEEILASSNNCLEKINEQSIEISKKAPDTVLFAVHVLERKVANVEYVLEREEDQGIGVIRRQCEQIVSDIQSITSEMQSKMDKETANLIIHEKYDEIVKYLQEALHSSVEDEQNFKQKADELQEIVFKLANSKCDRTEIAPIQEMLVKTEAMLRKVTMQTKQGDSTFDFNTPSNRFGLGGNSGTNNQNINGYNKKEIDELLNLKVDKETFELQLQNMSKNMKKSRRLSNTMLPNGSSVYNSNNLFDMANQGLNKSDAGLREQMMWKSLADNIKNESDLALVKANGLNKGISVVLGTNRAGQQYLMSSMNTGLGSSLDDSQMTGLHYGSQFNHGSLGTASGMMGMTQDEYNAYLETKQAQIGKQSSITLPLAMNTGNNGTFKMASESGKAGGRYGSPGQRPNSGKDGPENYGSPGANSVEYPQGIQPIAEVPAQNISGPVTGSDMSYLGAPIVGGGYNSKASNIRTQALKSSAGFADNSADLEAAGFLVKGHDGKFYYTDEPEASVDVGNKAATAKKLVPKMKRIVKQ